MKLQQREKLRILSEYWGQAGDKVSNNDLKRIQRIFRSQTFQTVE